MQTKTKAAPALRRRTLHFLTPWNGLFLLGTLLAIAFLPAHAQIKVRPEVGTGGSMCGDAGACMPVQGDVPQLVKPAIPDDEKCLPWSLSPAPVTALSVTTLKVPAKARGEYQKACSASLKKKYDDAERYSRSAISKFQDYAAAWVMLGVVLDEEHKEPDARDACSRAADIDGKYLPAYLCMAEFSARSREWEKLLTLSNAAARFGSENEGYAYYYRAMAELYLHNVSEAEQSALKAAHVDVNHNYLPLYLLLAQIDDAKGDRPAARAQLQMLLKHRLSPEQESLVKEYVARLDANQPIAPTEKRPSANPGPPQPDDQTIFSMADLRKINGNSVPADIDEAVPPVTPGVACALPEVLDGAGQKIVELVHNVDRFTATEMLVHQVIDRTGQMGPASAAQFSYLVSYSQDRAGYFQVDELRNGGLSLDDVFPNHIATLGTPSLVLIFHPRNVGNFKMECEGLGQWHGQPAWQVRFEQLPDKPNLTYSFTINRMTYDVNLRGRAWILADSFQVARLETDLAQAVPKIRLRLDHQTVEYRPIESPTTHAQLWLPSSTELYMDFLGRRFYRKHAFTDFRIFSVDTQYQVTKPKGADAEPGPADAAPESQTNGTR